MVTVAAQNFFIEAQPYALEFDPAATALIVIDMQRDFVEPGGFGSRAALVKCWATTFRFCAAP